ncbi:sigma-70 region 4 domain-containing protein [Streptomyces sp. ISL-99]|uniref:sigma-70 region 4 domain-containing protein n=1 Tax=Streptomyces sp. ISL-99 TaxID=2819193 RepID=UPI001BED38F4|nr:sigma-70 region 4 domain-containing protein [Streptomyces sp. ISL-99]MBT2529924.1 sigma-70 region 4 domain-containing protein [Streptomyces sp. ISL-99]
MAAKPHQGSSGRSSVRAHQPSGLSEPLTICLPLDYTAFCLLYRDAYLRYAQARLADAETSRTVVEMALGQLALNWSAALSSCPAAVAWQLLGHLITLSSGQAAAVATGREDIYRQLPAVQADAVILCHRLSLTPGQAAALMGVEEPAVNSRLSAALRRLPAA